MGSLFLHHLMIGIQKQTAKMKNIMEHRTGFSVKLKTLSFIIIYITKNPFLKRLVINIYSDYLV